MTSVVIVQDHAGYTNRVRALRDAHPRVHAVTPWDKPHPHAASFRPPEEWIPTAPAMPYARKCWWKADAMGFAAVRQLGIRGDFYWFIESDVTASQARWRALFADFAADPSDLVGPMIRTRQQRPRSSQWSAAPEWATHFLLMACFRISHRALVECTRHAEAMRDCFSEVAIPSVIHRAGMSMVGLNVRQTHSNTQTFAAHPERVVINPDLLNHPVKSNTYAP